MSIINITNKSNPIRISSIVDRNYLNGANRIFISGNFSYVTAAVNDSINIINITNKSNPVRVGSLSDSIWFDGITGVHVIGDYAYVTGQTSDSFNIVNITNKSNPVRTGSIKDNWINFTEELFVVGDYAYVTGQVNDSISIINISNKSNPVRVGSLSSPSLNAAAGIYVVGDYAYVAGLSNDSINIITINETYSSGTYESNVIDGGSKQIWSSVAWSETEPTGTNLSISFRSCDDSACSGESYGGSDDSSTSTLSVSNNRYFQFKVNFITTNLSLTPQLNSINITHTNTATTTPTTSTSDSGSALSEPETLVEESRSYSEITPESGAIITNLEEDIGIKEIRIEVTSTASNVKVEIKKHSGKPITILTEAPGIIYKYLEITTTNLEDKLDKAVITIQVRKSWVSDNSIEKNQVTLFKFNENSNSWNGLAATYTNENEEFYFYETKLDSFSFFAISGKALVERDPITTSKKTVSVWIILGIIALAIVAWILLKKKK